MTRKRKSVFSNPAMKAILVILLVLIVAVGATGAYVVMALMPLKNVKNQADVVAVSGRELAAAFKDQDLEKAKTALTKTKADFETMKSEYKKVGKLAGFPFMGPYIADGNRVMKAGDAGLEAVRLAIEALEPNADLLGFKGGSKFVSGSADERIQVAVKTMKALTPKIAEMAVQIDTLKNEIDAVDPDRYPETFRGQKVRSRIVDVKQLIDNTAGLFVNAQPLLTSLPSILGEPNEKRYLILFQNDKELRPTGGFLTAFAQFRLSRGKIILERSDDIYKLDAALTKQFPAPREILTFHQGVYNLHIRDSNLSPDFKESMLTFEKMYDTAKGKEKIDGIIALDTHVLVEALRILGPETIENRVFSADIDKRCDCPRAVYELEDYATRPVGYIRDDRKGVIGSLLQQLMQKALGVSPSQYWGKLFQMLVSEINQKHFMAYFHDPEAQKGAESFNMAGRIMRGDATTALVKYGADSSWDYLHINNANMAGAKSNMFVSNAYTKDVTVNGDGTVTTKLTLDYKNPYPGSDCNLERGGLCLNAPLRNWLRIYVPKGSVLKESKGIQSPKSKKPEQMQTMEDLEKTVFEGFLIVNPLGSAKVEVTYTSPVTLKDGKYRLLVQKQAGTDKQEFTLKVNNRKMESELIGDTEYVLTP